MTTTFILGAGVTGLAAAHASRLPAFEAEAQPGGICSSYYMRPGDDRRSHVAPELNDGYRFEIGGGHWIFGGEPAALELMRKLAPMRSYQRRSSVYLPDRELFVPYPIQNHLRFLRPAERDAALDEILNGPQAEPPRTMAEWIDVNFGHTLAALFFHPFHELYTAGLWKRIAPQDPYKSPLDKAAVREGASNEVELVGYNTSFLYPEDGLDALARALATGLDVRYGARVESIDPNAKTILLTDGSSVQYDSILTTLPLNRMLGMTALTVDSREDPYTSVLVINIGGRRGERCPDDHWVYVPQSQTGFHRVGFYSNVDPSFVPATYRDAVTHVSIYVEMAFVGGTKPSADEIVRLCRATVAELGSWGWIDDAEVVDPTWIDVAYTWSWPGSTWVQDAIAKLESVDIYPVGRYARWIFQGIADSIRDGTTAGEGLANRG